MKKLFSFVTFCFIFSTFALQAQENRENRTYYINQNGQVVEYNGTAPSTGYYLSESGYIRSLTKTDTHWYSYNGSAIVAYENVNKSNVKKYYIGEDLKLHEQLGNGAERSYYVNEYGKLLEGKGKPKNNGTN